MVILLTISLICFILSIFIFFFEIYIFKNAPFLEDTEFIGRIETSLTIIIPCFNEEINIVNCLTALSKINNPCLNYKIIIVDDCSTDKTFLNAQNCKKELFNNSENINIISAGPRPKDKNWVGKNWACFKAAEKANSEWLLFLDADVVVEEKCIFNALNKSYKENIDLLSLAPKVNCNCLAEWIVQPIMTSLLMIGFPISSTNDKDSNLAFAAGPFMLFKSSAYYKIGGHEGSFDQVVEDLALARKIKENNLKLKFLIALKDVSLNMYKDLNALVEGWSKNWFLGLDKNIFKSITASIFVLLAYSMPWIVFLTSLPLVFINNSPINTFICLFSFCSLFIYALKRYWLKINYRIPNKYWYLNGFGGILILYISILSIYKTYTGIGWTWKGRKLFQ
tara:strand:- start:500 stop:1681 length:1182 start_codon:yes stop_codon:yes gene_type:complete